MDRFPTHSQNPFSDLLVQRPLAFPQQFSHQSSNSSYIPDLDERFFSASKKRLKTERSYLNVPGPVREPLSIFPIHTSQIQQNQAIQELIQIDFQRQNQPVDLTNRLTKQIREVPQSTFSQEVLQQTNHTHSLSNPISAPFQCPMSNSTCSSHQHTCMPIQSPFLQNLLARTQQNALNMSSSGNMMMSSPFLQFNPQNDNSLVEYFAKEQEEFKQFVQKIKEIIITCSNPPAESESEDEPSTTLNAQQPPVEHSFGETRVTSERIMEDDVKMTPQEKKETKRNSPQRRKNKGRENAI